LHFNFEENNKDFHFWWDINNEAIRALLKDIIDARALNEIFKMTINTSEFCIYNTDDKIVANLDIFDFPTLYFTLVRVRRIKGYKKEANNIKKIMENAHATKLKDILKFIFEKVGLVVDKYSTKIYTDIKKDEIAYNATKIILKHLLNLIEKNIKGIKFQIDTEFLHDFRVAVRRTRTALSLLKGVFKEESAVPFNKAFAEITNRTNRARDLDIQYLYLIKLKFDMPEELMPGLVLLIDHLNNLRIKEYSKLSKFLTTQKFNNTINKWKKFLEIDNIEHSGENGLKPVVKIAPCFIYKALRRVEKKYQVVVKDFNPINLHKMRISCKKLRYVLEFFSPLYDESIYEKAIEALKTLQDALGLYQDVEVQKKMFLEIIDGLSKIESITTDVFMTTGYLLRLLDERQQSSETNFIEYFDNFIDLINSKKFRKVLSF
jgi:CHAD domain-containing protein